MKRELKAFLCAGLWFWFASCEEVVDGAAANSTSISSSNLEQGKLIADAAGTYLIQPNADDSVSAVGDGDLDVLGTDADLNQLAFRQRFGLETPAAQEMSAWEKYDSRLTVYMEGESDWRDPTVASPNWTGTRWNGDPMAVAGTTIAVDWRRIPQGSLVYIPSLNMYAEAIDRGAWDRWAADDRGQAHYGASGAGRIDVYSHRAGRSIQETTRDFHDWVGDSEHGEIHIVQRGSGWKNRRQ
jgi:3D (Asp-Asp-Asp) domain-containing protein